MLEVSLLLRKRVRGKVEKIPKDSTKIKRTKTFKEFKEEIRSKFNITDKEITIKALSSDKEEINVNNEESYTDEDNQCLTQYIVYIDIEEDNLNNTGDLNIEEIFNIKNDLFIDENEFKDMLDKQIDISKISPEIKIDEKEKELNLEPEEQILGNFFKDFQAKIKPVTDNNQKLFIDNIKKEFLSFEKLIKDKVESMKINIVKNIERTENLEEDIQGMRDSIQIIANSKMQPIMFNISLDKTEYEIFDNKAANIVIENIKLKNMSNQKVSLQNKCWIKDKNSDEDIIIPPNKNILNGNENLDENEEKIQNLILSINNPESNKIYNLKFYLGDNTYNNSVYKKVTNNTLTLSIKIKEKEIIQPPKQLQIQPTKDEQKDEKIKDEEIKKEEIKKEEIKKEKVKIEEKPDIPVKKIPKVDNPTIENHEKIEEKPEDNPNVDVPNINLDGELTDEQVEEIYNTLDENYGISGFLDDDNAFKQKIREMRGNLEELKNYVESII